MHAVLPNSQAGNINDPSTSTGDFRYHLAKETIDAKDIAQLIEWLQGGPWLTQGPVVRQFEEGWAGYLGTEHAVNCNSGSSANMLMYAALQSAGRLKNNKVIVPAIGWATTVTPAIQLGLEPIMCDVDEATFGMDMDQLAALCEEHDPGAVIVVHVLGVPCDVEALLALKQKHGFSLMEDACAATGSRYDGTLVGNFGDLSSYSFYFGHHLSTIEGGMVCTSDGELHEHLLHLRSHGWAKDLSPERQNQLAADHGVDPFNKPFTFYYPGFNFRSTDLQGRLGLSQIAKVERVVGRRIENHKLYQERFAAAEGFTFQRNRRAEICSISFVTLAPDAQTRTEIGARLAEARIETRPLGGGSLARQPFWANRYGAQDFAMADRIGATAFQLPNHPGLDASDIHAICDVALQGR